MLAYSRERLKLVCYAGHRPQDFSEPGGISCAVWYDQGLGVLRALHFK